MPTPQGEPAQVELALGLEYVRAIEAAGGIPVVIPPLVPEVAAPLLARLSGVCLSGGPDLDPAAYGGPPHPNLGPTEPAVDRFELDVARVAWELGMPILAICRGAQALNVSRGGTLVQHLPDVVGMSLEHRQSGSAGIPTHEVAVKPGSLLEGLVGRSMLKVNSFHHQAVERLGKGLNVAARAGDGVIEAVEGKSRPFVIGVQWHAECLTRRHGHAALFEGLTQSARGVRPPAQLGGSMTSRNAHWAAVDAARLRRGLHDRHRGRGDAAASARLVAGTADRPGPGCAGPGAGRPTRPPRRTNRRWSWRPACTRRSVRQSTSCTGCGWSWSARLPCWGSRLPAPAHIRSPCGTRRWSRAAAVIRRCTAQCGSSPGESPPSDSTCTSGSATPRTRSGSPTRCAGISRCCWRCRRTRRSGRAATPVSPRRARPCSRHFRGSASRAGSPTTTTTSPRSTC